MGRATCKGVLPSAVRMVTGNTPPHITTVECCARRQLQQQQHIRVECGQLPCRCLARGSVWEVLGECSSC